jgi:hypothetical protein
VILVGTQKKKLAICLFLSLDMTLERARKSFGKYIGSLIDHSGDIGMIIDIEMNGGPKDSDKYPVFVIEWYSDYLNVIFKKNLSYHTVTGVLAGSNWKIS